ncbi:MAG: hypothetical protein FWF96_05010, partial [Kiritimatiellaeota bacterium]|nr:hypothetical protein [Kiritimatiellota bacterium]
YFDLRGGSVRLFNGHDYHANIVAFDAGQTTFEITNATLTLHANDTFSMGRADAPAGDRTVVRVLQGGVLNALAMRLGERSANNLLRIDGGTFNQTGGTSISGGVGGHSNRLEIVNNATYTGTGPITMSRTDHHCLLVDNATLTLDDGNYAGGSDIITLGYGNGSEGGGYHHVAAFSNNAVVTIGKITVGGAWSLARLVVDHATLTIQDSGTIDGLYVGSGGTANNRADILNNSVVDILRNGLCVGNNGNNNFLNIEHSTVNCSGGWGFNICRGNGVNNVARIGPGANVIANSQVTISQNRTAGNELRLAGGTIVSHGKLEWFANGVLGVEIQTDGLPGHLVLNASGGNSFEANRVLRPRAVKGALPGTYLVLESTSTYTFTDNFVFDLPADQEDRWSYEVVGGKQLYVTYKRPYTLFMVK